MKKIKSYTSIWNVEKVIYAINDLQLPFPITFTQMTWFVVSILFVILFSHIPPLSFIDGAFLKYLGFPVAITWFMSQKTFDGKKPYGFLKSILSYFFRSKLTYAYKPIKLKSQKLNESITIVRSELHEISD
ncbi:conjugal transfer protein [Listeria monocytogenes]|uniref:conjugal transfer protein n=1 Tax=Listeria TaxID=1637 RepID=UPI0011EB799A|nr:MULTISPECIES: conjugal transfer protein [Listeria]EHZ7795104.1 conjugal transfer protein [Listeria monocytogenes]EHZ7802624.1 conjugal transfer protein [Listeria monocytogenes]EHZ7811327.1 conjugal transfer protein [Listeria monocytogenes]EIG9587481.1 conjugal transfer protein [Listeria monocytogenes]EJH4993801.1 conjugal transfer protein [Listeria monocytogenes]